MTVVSGCFDIIHPGHVALIEAAGYTGFPPVVALINSDASMTRIKRFPVMNQEARKTVLEGIRWIWKVYIFDEDNPSKLISVLKPECLVKGSDYEGKEFPEKAIVESYGGQIVYVPLVPGWHSSEIKGRL